MSSEIHPSKYPQARHDDSVVDVLHGQKIADPFRWLEDPDSEETKKFVNELNNLSEPFIRESGLKEKIQARLTKSWDYEKYGSTSKHGDKYYVFYNAGLQNQSVLYQSDSYKEKGRVFYDVNKESADGTTAICSYCWTDDGTHVAFNLADKGSDVNYVHFFDKEGKKLKDTLKNIKFSGVDWLITNAGVIYSTYPELKKTSDKVLVKAQLNHSLYYHKMGTDESEDIMILDFPDRPRDSVGASITEDGNFMVIHTSDNCGISNRLYYYDLSAVGHKIDGRIDVKPLFTDNKNIYEFVTNVGKDEALIITNRDAPMRKLIKVKFGKSEDSANWKVMIDHDPKKKLEAVIPFAGDKFMALFLEDVHSVLQIHDLATGKFIEKIPIKIGSVSSIFARLSRSEVFFAFESILEPPTTYRFDYADKHEQNQIKLELVYQPKIHGYNPDDYRTEQVFYTSKDGTKVPMFITAKKDIKLDNQNPTLLYGYGGFDVSLEPYFSNSRIYWMKSGGVHAVANIRGGGEYGEKWHKAGIREKKQNVFDDFHAAAEFLSKPNGYTKKEKLYIQGGSNGGLLVTACACQRPDLYGAVIGEVGVLDMLRFHKFTIGHAWMGDYGNPDEAEDFEFLRKYSPLHNIHVNPEHQWPAMLLLTADHDDRVTPCHTLKFMAQLYHTVAKEGLDKQRNPLLASINVDAGHGAGKPTTKILEELAKIYAFVHRVLKVPYVEEK